MPGLRGQGDPYRDDSHYTVSGFPRKPFTPERDAAVGLLQELRSLGGIMLIVFMLIAALCLIPELQHARNEWLKIPQATAHK